ncbi:MAG: SPOR domain-containing protein [Bdellovibrionales bacterium]|nr:SPOR domain-containing protein [Bdellovibrionales bacterium]
MNRKTLRTWEIRLGLMHVVAFLGVVMGIMVCVFLLAFVFGHNAGFEAAARQSLDSIARLPVDIDGKLPERAEQEEIEKQVYAALSADDQVDESETENLPDLGSIPEAKDAPIVEEDGLAKLDEALRKEEEAKLAEDLASPDSKNKVENSNPDKKGNAQKVVQAEAGIKIVGKTGSVIVIDEDKPNEAKKATLTELLSDETSATSAQNKEAAAVEELLPEPSHPVIEKPKNNVEENKNIQIPTTTEKLDKPSDKIAQEKIEIVGLESNKLEQAPVENSALAGVAKGDFIRSVIPRGWYAQLAAPRIVSDANTLANKLRSSGFPVMIEKAVVRNQEYFRVLVGPEQNKTLANRLLEQIKREPYISGEPFIRNVQ